ncbi:peptidase U32 family protein [Shewanella sp. UCD-KL12]|uniref:peptidase U32 family protein n=1 Tax=Shewanella sp. UCD-KL12 TaxID=1917163 RepID=UPI000971466A|nr:peptidase U32 family protein [Shewanella sp. UCD-KL12]
MSQKIELLAPGGDVEAIKAAIVAGANAVYCGLDTFNARNRAANLSFDQLCGVLRLAHQHNCQVFLTINVVILEQELPALFKLLNHLVNTSLDGIIVQDLGLFNLVKHHFPTLDIHASTQLTTHNEGQIEFLAKVGASRVNLSRELNLAEVASLTALAHQHDLLTEVFVHGSLCIAFSGQCYSSSVSVGNSGNRGRCSQACRDEYEETEAGNKYPLNLKDNSAYFDLPELVEAKVDSLKIEGRIKGAHYVYTVVDSWRKQINRFVETGQLLEDDANLHKVFNRDFTNSFLKGDLTKSMFIDNPRDHSVKHAIDKSNAISVVQIQEVRQELRADKNELGLTLKDKVQHLNIDKQALTLSFKAKLNEPLTVTATIASNAPQSFEDSQSPKDPQSSKDKVFTVSSSATLISVEKSALDQQTLEKRFKNINNVDYDITAFDFSELDLGLSIPFKALTALKNQLAFLLNNSVEIAAPVDVPKLKQQEKVTAKPRLSILISDESDAYLAEHTDADIYFKLPESYKRGCTKFIDILQRNPQLIPWFPAIQIGKDYASAVRLLEALQPKRIVSNNTGVAYKAFEMGIEWIAGPLLNTTNSYALKTLQEELNCAGAFISNEINRMQMRNIKRPEGFKLLYSVYHPILMMTSRQCFFQQTVGCNKPSIEDGCMQRCEKATTITNVKGVSFAVDKQKGGYPSIYNHEQFLNLDVIEDFSDLFDEFFIDLTDIGSGSKAKLDKTQLIEHFEQLLDNTPQQRETLSVQSVAPASAQLKAMVEISTNAQYKQGL